MTQGWKNIEYPCIYGSWIARGTWYKGSTLQYNTAFCDSNTSFRSACCKVSGTLSWVVFDASAALPVSVAFVDTPFWLLLAALYDLLSLATICTTALSCFPSCTVLPSFAPSTFSLAECKKIEELCTLSSISHDSKDITSGYFLHIWARWGRLRQVAYHWDPIASSSTTTSSSNQPKPQARPNQTNQPTNQPNKQASQPPRPNRQPNNQPTKYIKDETIKDQQTTTNNERQWTAIATTAVAKPTTTATVLCGIA